MVRLISRQRGGLAALKLTKLFGIDDFPAAKDSGKVLIIIIYCYLIINKPSGIVWVQFYHSNVGQKTRNEKRKLYKESNTHELQ